MVLLVLALVITGGRRLRQLRYLDGDPAVLRFCGLKQLPAFRSVSRWLSRSDDRFVESLKRLNAEITHERIEQAGLRRLTIDIDGSVLSTGLQVEGARRGYNPHQRKVPSYYPITAYESQTGQILSVLNRPGNVHDGKAGVAFVEQVIDSLRDRFSRSTLLEFRMDGAFFRQDVLDLLDREGAEYAIKVPFWPWVGLKTLVQARRRWFRINRELGWFETTLYLTPWRRHFRVVVFRKKVRHRSPKNYQLDLFDPSNGHYEYSAIVTNKTLSAPYLRDFMNGRGIHEKVYSELKNGFAFDAIPTQRFAANSAWQLLSVLAFNLTRAFQSATTATERTTDRKRRSRSRFEAIHTLRFECLHRAGLITKPRGHQTLDVGTAPGVVARFSKINERLRKAA